VHERIEMVENTLSRPESGDVDLSFDPGSGVNGEVAVIAMQPLGATPTLAFPALSLQTRSVSEITHVLGRLALNQARHET